MIKHKYLFIADSDFLYSSGQTFKLCTLFDIEKRAGDLNYHDVRKWLFFIENGRLIRSTFGNRLTGLRLCRTKKQII